MDKRKKTIGDEFIHSSLQVSNCYFEMDSFMDWFCQIKSNDFFTVKQIPFSELKNWYYDGNTNLVHSSGKFFSIEGLSIKNNFYPVEEWEQPIIVQPEIGILGIITKKINGIRYFLMQAKMEPGNVNLLQLSPTVQATRSNYTQVHKGKLPPYLEYFLDKSKSLVLVDQLQSEQGGRFFKKRNRNMIVEIFEDIDLDSNFCWLTLGQIKELLKIDNFVNMDARSVISCIPFIDEEKNVSDSNENDYNKALERYGIKNDFSQEILKSILINDNTYNNYNQVISWLTEMKTKYSTTVQRIPLGEVKNWVKDDWTIRHSDKPFFTVMAVSVEAGNREVKSWCQPLIGEKSIGLIGLIAKKINGILHFLIQAKFEPGYVDFIELAPTISSSNIEYRKTLKEKPPFFDLFINAEDNKIRYSSIQSEEGGRFYQFQNKNMIIEIDENEEIDVPENFTWLTLSQIIELIKFSYFNIEARSLISCISLL